MTRTSSYLHAFFIYNIVHSIKSRHIRKQDQITKKKTTKKNKAKTEHYLDMDFKITMINMLNKGKNGARPCQHLDFELLGSRTGGELIFVIFSHPVGGSLQPQETHTLPDFKIRAVSRGDRLQPQPRGLRMKAGEGSLLVPSGMSSRGG